MAVTNQCPYCCDSMRVSAMHCDSCRVTIEARFPTSRLADLPTEHQRFIELFVLAGGSLKQIAQQAGVSYPTVRSRLDKVIETIRAAVEETGPHEGEAGRKQPDAAQVIKSI